MQYANMLKKLFHDIELNVEDLLFLESFQIGYLPDRAPKQELAALLRENPLIQRYMVSICPSVKPFVDGILLQEPTNNKSIKDNCQDLLWEIADLIVYSKYPEAYDKNVEFPWKIDEIIQPESLNGKTIIDAGAGPGKLSLLLAGFAGTVYAVEPVSGFRKLIRQKTQKSQNNNLFTIDGSLDSLPFPDKSIDGLITSQAMGWNIQSELLEIERVIKPRGWAIHLFSDADSKSAMGLHEPLTSNGYKCTRIHKSLGTKLRYQKIMEEL